jgi:hypothetical protein
MLFRRACASFALLLVVFASGCCHDRWCCRHPFAPRCRPACCPETSCGCCNAVGYPPAETVAPPVGPIISPSSGAVGAGSR